MSKDRQWLPFSDRNTVGWGLGFAATAGILTLLSIFCLIVDQVAHYSEQIYHKLLEERGIIAYEPYTTDLMAPGPAPSQCGTESKLVAGGVPSLFMTGSLPSVVGAGGALAATDPAGRISSVLKGAKNTLLSRYGETRTTIPGLEPEVQTTSGAVASARLRETLQRDKRPQPTGGNNAKQSGSIHSLSQSNISGDRQAERSVIVYGTSTGNIMKDSAV